MCVIVARALYYIMWAELGHSHESGNVEHVTWMESSVSRVVLETTGNSNFSKSDTECMCKNFLWQQNEWKDKITREVIIILVV